jgi:peptide-methionine (R)-S-oxide reductase
MAMLNQPSFPSRRLVLFAATALAACGPAVGAAPDAYAASPFRKLSADDWRARLPAASFGVLRQEDTERSFSSPLNDEHRKGTFVCLGCGLALFSSNWKFESGTGWPSFYTAFAGALVKKTDMKIGIPRTEYHCARCLGHQGHVFDDGPRPTGLRYCNNGVALKFIPA